MSTLDLPPGDTHNTISRLSINLSSLLLGLAVCWRHLSWAGEAATEKEARGGVKRPEGNRETQGREEEVDLQASR